MSKESPTPSVTGMLGNSGSCPEVSHGGKVCKIGHPSQGSKAELERLVVAVAGREVFELKGVLPPAQYAEILSSFTKMVSGGAYKTWAPGWQEVTTGNPHLFLLALLRENHPEAKEADAVSLQDGCDDQVGVALAQVLPGFIKLLLRERKDVTPEQREQIAGEFAAGLSKAISIRQSSTPTTANTAT